MIALPATFNEQYNPQTFTWPLPGYVDGPMYPFALQNSLNQDSQNWWKLQNQIQKILKSSPAAVQRLIGRNKSKLVPVDQLLPSPTHAAHGRLFNHFSGSLKLPRLHLHPPRPPTDYCRRREHTAHCTARGQTQPPRRQTLLTSRRALPSSIQHRWENGHSDCSRDEITVLPIVHPFLIHVQLLLITHYFFYTFP